MDPIQAKVTIRILGGGQLGVELAALYPNAFVARAYDVIGTPEDLPGMLEMLEGEHKVAYQTFTSRPGFKPLGDE